jgi:uncharacterized protein
MVVRVVSLHIYPIKGVRAIDLERSEVEHRGLAGDRRWMVVDENGLFRSQRTVPAMACVAASQIEGGLLLSAAGQGAIAAVVGNQDPRRTVTVWQSEVAAIDAGDSVAEWLSKVLDCPARLVYMPDDSERSCPPGYSQENDIVSFADGFPILLTHVNSLEDLNDRMDSPVPMTRFRPNIVVEGADPWSEDDWQLMQIGDVILENAKPCGRCSVTTVDQEQGRPTGQEPLRTLATFRKVESSVNFGVNLIPRRVGSIQVGDVVTLNA